MDNQGPNNYNGGGQGPGGGRGGKNNGQFIMLFILFSLIMLFVMSMVTNQFNQMSTQEVSYSEFLDMVSGEGEWEGRHVESVQIGSYQIDIHLDRDERMPYEITYYCGRVADDDLIPLLKEHDVEIFGVIPDNTSTWIFSILSYLIPIALIWILLGFVMRRMGGGAMGVGKNTAKVYVERQTGVTFKDVAGQDEAKESLQEIVDFLHNPGKYRDIGAKLPKGALLVGPPGTGKTLLAKAVAGEAKVPFFSLAGSDFVEMFVGVGASRVRDLFKEAQKQAPCIIFIDEIDAIGKSRDTRYGGNDEREQTLNQLLAEMDGFDTSKGLLILAATNRPEVLDKALLRPGRFDRRIIVDKPDLKGRLDTLKVHSKGVLMDETVDLDALALATAGLVGSDLANMINEAAINAVKGGRKFVNQSDLFAAFELVAVGGKEKKDRVMSEKERRIVAYHEVGHAMVTALQKNTEPVQKITIVPRTMGALGYTLQTPEEEKYLETKDELIAKITTYMAGRAAEMLVFNSATSGAANDIENATNIARAMVTQYGMSDKFGMMCLATVENQYLDNRAGLICGEDTAAQIDAEVLAIINSAYDEAMRLLAENRTVLDEIADYLYEHETITGKEFMQIFRRLKGIPEPAEEEGEKKKTFFEQAEEARKALSAPQGAQNAQQGGIVPPQGGNTPQSGMMPQGGNMPQGGSMPPSGAPQGSMPQGGGMMPQGGMPQQGGSVPPGNMPSGAQGAQGIQNAPGSFAPQGMPPQGGNMSPGSMPSGTMPPGGDTPQGMPLQGMPQGGNTPQGGSVPPGGYGSPYGNPYAQAPQGAAPQGTQSTQGAQGAQGSQSAPSASPQGVSGAPGTQGSQSAPGVSPQGSQGAPGTQGPQPAPGASPQDSQGTSEGGDGKGSFASHAEGDQTDGSRG